MLEVNVEEEETNDAAGTDVGNAVGVMGFKCSTDTLTSCREQLIQILSKAPHSDGGSCSSPVVATSIMGHDDDADGGDDDDGDDEDGRGPSMRESQNRPHCSSIFMLLARVYCSGGGVDDDNEAAAVADDDGDESEAGADDDLELVDEEDETTATLPLETDDADDEVEADF
jgi:hypothetical protein